MITVIAGDAYHVEAARQNEKARAFMFTETVLDDLCNDSNTTFCVPYCYATEKELKNLKLSGDEEGFIFCPGIYPSKVKNAELVVYRMTYQDAKNFVVSRLKIDDQALRLLFEKLNIAPRDSEYDFFKLQHVCSLMECENSITVTQINEFIDDEPDANVFKLSTFIQMKDLTKVYNLAKKIVEEPSFSAFRLFGLLEKTYRKALKASALIESGMDKANAEKIIGENVYQTCNKCEALRALNAISSARKSVVEGQYSEKTSFVMLVSYLSH